MSPPPIESARAGTTRVRKVERVVREKRREREGLIGGSGFFVSSGCVVAEDEEGVGEVGVSREALEDVAE